MGRSKGGHTWGRRPWLSTVRIYAQETSITRYSVHGLTNLKSQPRGTVIKKFFLSSVAKAWHSDSQYVQGVRSCSWQQGGRQKCCEMSFSLPSSWALLMPLCLCSCQVSSASVLSTCPCATACRFCWCLACHSKRILQHNSQSCGEGHDARLDAAITQ